MKCISLSLFQCCLTRKSVAAPAPPQHISDDATSEEDGIDTQFPLITDIVDATLKDGRFQKFRYSELRQATNDFTRHLGRGGFGSVYYGKLQDGREVAIKRYHKLGDKTLELFLNEIKLSSPLRHPNLISFYGYSCCLSHKPLLVYEYVSNGTLSSHVHGIKKEERRTLPWFTRLKIAIETASALAYLHDSGVIHRDVKSSNILLDENLSAKVADFGLLRSLPLVGSGYGTHVSTAPQGTHGYMDPDYWQLQRVSDKSDVYSFGVVLCELISSRQALHTERIDGDDLYLATFAASKIQDEELHQLVDPSLGFDSDNEIRHTITVVAELAFLCLQCPKDLRPSMKQVLETLEGIREGTWGFYQIT